MKILVLLVVSLLGSFPLVAQSPMSSASPDPSLPKGLRVFTVGHSFHVWVWGVLANMAESAGIQGHDRKAMYFGGSTVLDCWNIPQAMR
ncbi:MAG: hypothetical protein WC076_13920 [Terrimicrobiaceae bacterium]|jgi:hypothetical protein|nr:hypothetical protein [Terrimicrobiaceae bacterium]